MENEEIVCSCGAMAFVEKKVIEMTTKNMTLYEIKCPKCHKKVMATHKNLAIRNWER